jgi:predicted nucleotidyltransferase
VATGSDFVAARESLIERLKVAAATDDRIAACWLRGSLADGSADALSDVDAYLAVRDEDFDTVFAERRAIVARLGRVLFLADGIIPGLDAVNAILEGPAKLDLVFERLSRSPEVQRPAAVMLVDRVGLGPRLQTGWEPSLDSVGRRISALYSGIRQGGAWPIRLLLRGQWAMFATVELRLINENLATLMAVRVYPRLLFKNPFTMPRLLPQEQQAELEAFSLALVEGVARRDLTALRDLHLRIFDAVVGEGKAALAGLGLSYPGTDAGDARTRAMYAQQWPADVPSPAEE